MRIEVHRFLASAMFIPPNTISPFETCVCENNFQRAPCLLCMENCFLLLKRCAEILKSNPYGGHSFVFEKKKGTFFRKSKWRSMIYNISKLTSVFHASVLLLIMNLFRYNIVRVAVDPRVVSPSEQLAIVQVNLRLSKWTSQNVRQKCARNFKVYSIWRDQIHNSPRSFSG